MKINKEIIARLDIHVLTLLTLKDITTVEVLVQEDFLVGVNELILSTAKTNPAVLTNYIIWRVLAAFYPDRPADSRARCVNSDYYCPRKMLPISAPNLYPKSN